MDQEPFVIQEIKVQINVTEENNQSELPEPTKQVDSTSQKVAAVIPREILFIEDDQFIGEMYIRGLRKAGYKVDFASTGTEGLAKAMSGKYNLILLDIFLPEKTGIDVLNELRNGETNKLPGTKIVIMTNYAHDDESRAALEAQADGYFIKADITPNKLVELVKQIIG